MKITRTLSGEARTAVKQEKRIPETLRNFELLPDSALVRVDTVAGLFGQCKASIWNGVKSGRIPAPKKVSPRVTAWRVADLRRALESL